MCEPVNAAQGECVAPLDRGDIKEALEAARRKPPGRTCSTPFGINR
ncbi:MAG: hypothetical protein ABI614_24925 [Planctomycetota bacterium]